MTEAMLLAHGLTVETLVDLIRAGLATAKAERVMAGGRAIEVARAGSRRRGGGRSHHNAGEDQWPQCDDPDYHGPMSRSRISHLPFRN